MFDCITIGAGPAGTTAAYHLAKRGYSVLMLDKASLPRYKPCGGGISPAIASWFDFDFAPVIDNTISSVRYTWKMAEPMELPLKLREPMWMVRRDIFDDFLARQARARGARLEDNTEVQGIELKGDRQWQVTTSKGIFTGSYLIAADGVAGPTSTWLGFKPKQKSFAATLEVKTPVSLEQKNIAHFDFGSVKNGFIWNFPKADGYSICAGVFKGGKTNPQEIKDRLVNYAAAFKIDLTNSQYFEHSLNLWTENRPLHARRALLVGEAAGILDPLLGEGIRPAIFTGLKAAEAIHQALIGDPDALPQYTRTIEREWGADMVLAQRIAGLFFQFPQICYKLAVKRPTAGQMMGRILCGELRYGDVTDRAIDTLKRSLIPGRGGK